MHTLESIADRQSIEARISAVTSGDPHLWGKMSAHQMICHLGDAYLLPLGEKTASMATGFLQRTLIKSIALNLLCAGPKAFQHARKWPKVSAAPPQPYFMKIARSFSPPCNGSALPSRFQSRTQFSGQ
jgi:hypothetical protein